MAFLPDDNNKQLDPNNPQTNQGNQIQQDPLTSGPVGGAVVSGSGGAQGSPVGPGGQGGWTNIQAYLQANKGNEAASANRLTDTVGGQFQKEKDNFTQKSTEQKNAAQNEVNQNYLGQDKASQLITQMGSQYKYKEPQGQDYNQWKNTIQGALNYQYQGPQGFSYGLDQKTQNLGNNLKDDGQFFNLMGDVYNEAAQGKMGQGGRSLQRQLDTNNEKLAQARASLLNQYSGLSDEIAQGTANTDQAVKASMNQLQQMPAEIQQYLTGKKDQELAAVDTGIQDYLKKAKDEAFNTRKYFNPKETNQYSMDRALYQGGRTNAEWDVYHAMMRAYAEGYGDSPPKKPSLAYTDPSKLNDQYIRDNLNYLDPNVTRETKGVSDQERARYNAILDALGLGGTIDQVGDGPGVGKYRIKDTVKTTDLPYYGKL